MCVCVIGVPYLKAIVAPCTISMRKTKWRGTKLLHLCKEPAECTCGCQWTCQLFHIEEAPLCVCVCNWCAILESHCCTMHNIDEEDEMEGHETFASVQGACRVHLWMSMDLPIVVQPVCALWKSYIGTYRVARSACSSCNRCQKDGKAHVGPASCAALGRCKA